MIEFDEQFLRHNLGLQPNSKQLAFMLLLCQRLMPGLQKFCVDTGNDFSPYQRCLAFGWKYLEEGLNMQRNEDIAQEYLESIPDTENFNHPLTSFALNAALSLSSLINFLSDHDVKHVVEVAKLAYDNAFLYAQFLEETTPISPNTQDIIKHPLVQQELEYQARTFDYLISLPTDIRSRTGNLVRMHAEEDSEIIPLQKILMREKNRKQ